MGECVIWLKGVKFCLFCKTILGSPVVFLGAGIDHLLESSHRGGWTPFCPQVGLVVKTDDAEDFPGGPVVKTPCFQCRGLGFDPWSGN